MYGLEDMAKQAEEFLEQDGNQEAAGSWVKWSHVNIPDKPEFTRETLRMLATAFGHCLECTALSGCYFWSEEGKVPRCPLHSVCHCELIPVAAPNAVAFCAQSKFTEYIYTEENADNGKRQAFMNIGFGIEDSAILKSEYERQAVQNYLSGNYSLAMGDERGQRIKIPITFPDPTNGTIVFDSIWMVQTNGRISCVTPMGS